MTGAAGAVADRGEASVGGDGIGTVDGVGGAVASLDCRKICSWTKEPTDRIALSTLLLMAATLSEYPEAFWPMARMPCKT